MEINAHVYTDIAALQFDMTELVTLNDWFKEYGFFFFFYESVMPMYWLSLIIQYG